MKQNHHKEKPISVVYSTDQNYLFYTCVSITSLAINSKEGIFYKIYILVGDDFVDKEQILDKLSLQYSNIEINICMVEQLALKSVNINNSHISKAAFFRLCVSDFVEEDRCIYLDSDTIVMEDLTQLWQFDLGNHYLAGCRDIWIDWLTDEEKETRRTKTNIPSMDQYINSGVLVFNLKKIRENHINCRFIEAMSYNYPYEDQDILNVCCYNHIKFLPAKWNRYTEVLGASLAMKAAKISRDIWKQYLLPEGIIHFTNKAGRPWEGTFSWKNWYWWTMAEKLSYTTQYKELKKHVEEKEKRASWSYFLEICQQHQEIVIWGFTPYAMELCDWIMLSQPDIKIRFCDSDKEKCSQSYRNISVVNPEQVLSEARKCLYIVASQRFGKEIQFKLQIHGIKEEDIWVYKRKGIEFYRMLDERYYQQELEEIFLKEGIDDLNLCNLEELHKNDKLCHKYYMDRWILKEKWGISLVKISVIVPVYNVERYLKQCLDSIISQTLKDIEIICVDDGSTDSSGEILDDYAKQDSRIKVYHKHNTGYGNTMNLGMNMATGEYISIIESDDYVEKDMLEKLYDAAVNNDAEIVKARHYDYKGGTDYLCDLIAEFPKMQLINSFKCPNLLKLAHTIWSCLYKRSFLEEHNIMFHETAGASFQDISFALQGWLWAQRVCFINDAVLHYRNDNPDSSMHNPNKVFCVFDEYEWIEQNFGEFWIEHPILEKYFVATKYWDYLSHYHRVAVQYQYALLLRIEQALKNDVQKKRMERSAFHPIIWNKVEAIQTDVNKFFQSTAKELRDMRLDMCHFENDKIYGEALIKQISKFPQVVVYGAGKIGQRLADVLKENGINIDYFAVTEVVDGKTEYEGIAIRELATLNYLSDTCAIIIAVTEKNQYELCQTVLRHGFKNIFRVDGTIRRSLNI